MIRAKYEKNNSQVVVFRVNNILYLHFDSINVSKLAYWTLLDGMHCGEHGVFILLMKILQQL